MPDEDIPFWALWIVAASLGIAVLVLQYNLVPQ